MKLPPFVLYISFSAIFPEHCGQGGGSIGSVIGPSVKRQMKCIRTIAVRMDLPVARKPKPKLTSGLARCVVKLTPGARGGAVTLIDKIPRNGDIARWNPAEPRVPKNGADVASFLDVVDG
jgi:hypothetical protein